MERVNGLIGEHERAKWLVAFNLFKDEGTVDLRCVANRGNLRSRPGSHPNQCTKSIQNEHNCKSSIFLLRKMVANTINPERGAPAERHGDMQVIIGPPRFVRNEHY